MARAPAAWRLASASSACALAAALALASCESVVGFDGSTYASVVDAMCSCPEMLQAFATESDCKTYVEAGLNRGTADDDAKWLAAFHTHECDLCAPDVTAKLACIEAPPLCRKAGESCHDPAECCGYSAQTAECVHADTSGAGSCGACKTLGDACATSDECCGHHAGARDLPYCSPMTHTCVVRSATCIKSGEPCTSSPQCCGSEGGMGTCTNKVCREPCNPDAPDNCPGCCAVGADGMTGECGDRIPGSCASYCNPNAVNNSCAPGLGCQSKCSLLMNNCAYVCAAT